MTVTSPEGDTVEVKDFNPVGVAIPEGLSEPLTGVAVEHSVGAMDEDVVGVGVREGVKRKDELWLVV